MKTYCIYAHINKINQKKYIGQTCQNLEDRWQNGRGYKACPKFYAAIQEYGWDNFDHVVLEENLTEHEANLREVYWIAFYNTFGEDSQGYNLTPGGDNYMEALWQDPIYRKKMCDSFSQARQKAWSNQEFAEKALEALLSGLRQAWADEEWRARRLQALMGSNNPNAKGVINLETGKYFATIKEAAAWLGHSSVSGIGQCCKGARKSCGKHPELGIALHWKYANDLTSDRTILERSVSAVKIPVMCINTQDIFESMSAAAKWAGLRDTGKSIKACCIGTQKTAGHHPITNERLSWSFIEKEVVI